MALARDDAHPTRSVAPDQRFTRGNPCPICHGFDGMRRGRGERCAGYYSEERTVAFCEQASLSGALRPIESPTGNVYAHRLTGECGCGETHDGSPRAALKSVSSGKTYTPGSKSWAIRDCAGVVQAIHVRRDYTDHKTLSWQLPDGSTNLRGRAAATLPLYGIHELSKYPADAPVYVTEGEKVRDALASIGVCAVATVTGAKGAPAPDVWADLAGRDVRFWPDNDADGMAHLVKCVEQADKAGVTLRVVAWPDAPVKGDAADYVAHGGAASALDGMTGAAMPTPERPYMEASDLMAMVFGDPLWIAPDLIPEGLTALSGKPKMGKSWLVLALAIARAGGGMFLGKHLDAGDVLYLALEDGPRAVQDRLRKLLYGAPVPRRLQIATSKDTDRWHMSLGGLDEMRQWLTSHPGGCIIVDTFARVKPRAKSNSNGYQDDYDHAKALKDVADTCGGAIIIVTHNRKASAEDPFDEINATMGFAGAFDTGIVIRRNRGEADAVLHMDSRLAPGCELALAFDKDTCLWRAMGDASDYAISKERRSTLEAIRAIEDGQGHTGARAKAIGEYLSVDANTLYKRLHDMEHDGQVRCLSRGVYTIGKDGKESKDSKQSKDGTETPILTDLTDLTNLTNLTNLTDIESEEREQGRASSDGRYCFRHRDEWMTRLPDGGYTPCARCAAE